MEPVPRLKLPDYWPFILILRILIFIIPKRFALRRKNRSHRFTDWLVMLNSFQHLFPQARHAELVSASVPTSPSCWTRFSIYSHKPVMLNLFQHLFPKARHAELVSASVPIDTSCWPPVAPVETLHASSLQWKSPAGLCVLASWWPKKNLEY